MDPALVVLAFAVLAAYVTQTVMGFGAMITALALGAHIYPLEDLLPVLVPVNTVLTGAIVWRHRSHIDRTLLLETILPFMVAGGILGVLLFHVAEGALLKRLYGGLVALFAAVELWRWRGGKLTGPERPLSPGRSAAWIGAAGVVHGMFATGGPLLVFVVSRLGLDKSAFRSTLCTVWLTLNLSLTAVYLVGGKLTMERAPLILLCLALIPFGLLLGEWGHARIDERRFRGAVMGLLLLAGVGLMR